MPLSTIIGASITGDYSITLSPEELRHHLQIFGKSGTGKTKFLLNLLQQNIKQGNGSFVIDPFGEYTSWTQNYKDFIMIIEPLSLEDGKQKITEFDFSSAINQNKIIILNLQSFIASLQRSLVPKDKDRSELGRVSLKKLSDTLLHKDSSKPFTIYLDEAQDWWQDDLKFFVSEGERYGVNVILAHQYLAPYAPKVLDLFFNKIGTYVIFPVGAADAEKISHENIPALESRLGQLGPHQGLLKRISGEIETFKIPSPPSAEPKN